MSKILIPIANTDTFQTFLTRTNDLVYELGTSVLTASFLGDVTVGSASLTGSFTANNVTVNNVFRTNIIDAKVGNTLPLEIRPDVLFSSTDQNVVTISNSVGPRLRHKNNNITWLSGLRGATGTGTGSEYIIWVEGQSNPTFRFSSSGFLYANTIVATNITGTVSLANQLVNTLNKGSFLLGTNFDGSANTTWSVDASSISASNKVIVRDALGNFAANTVYLTNLQLGATLVTSSGAQLNFVNGVTSDIQAQLNSKQVTITGAATTVVSSNLTTLRGLVSDGNGKIVASSVTAAEVAALSGVVAPIQQQIYDRVAVSQIVADVPSNYNWTTIPATAAVKNYVDSGNITHTGGNPGYYGARAWVTFSPGGMITYVGFGSMNRTGAGHYTFVFSVPMPDSGYAVLYTGDGFSVGSVAAKTTAGFDISFSTVGSSTIDPNPGHIVIFR